MKLNKFALWIVAIVIAMASYLPLLFLLAETPIHDGSELPSNFMMLLTLILSIFVGLLCVKIGSKWISK